MLQKTFFTMNTYLSGEGKIQYLCRTVINNIICNGVVESLRLSILEFLYLTLYNIINARLAALSAILQGLSLYYSEESRLYIIALLLSDVTMGASAVILSLPTTTQRHWSIGIRTPPADWMWQLLELLVTDHRCNLTFRLLERGSSAEQWE